ncbi:alpha/beta hydrolase [Sphingobium aquiterrae]|uniref:alpha/beta fold hydrolase n=1 Tax=Sphingobium aquiterrae TaxID=2038656 RepID=UPI00301A2F66
MATHVITGGAGDTPTLFLHGAIPGISPYCGGAHLWQGMLEGFGTDNRVLAIDLLGSGSTGFKTDEEPLTIDDIGAHALATLEALGVGRVHIVGHDLGGLVGLWIAMNAPDRVASVSVVASAAAAPIGDWVDDLVFLDPPPPFWSPASQRWALERISFTPGHIDAALLDNCVFAAQQPGPIAARKAMANPAARALFSASLSRTKSKLWALARDARFPVPLQVIWAAEDPLTTPAHGLVLFQTIGKSQPEAQYHLVNRSGNFIFREHPKRFQRLIRAFHQGLAMTEPQYRYA